MNMNLFGGYRVFAGGIPDCHLLAYFVYSIANMGVSKNNGTTKSSILIGVFIINHPFGDTTIFENIHIGLYSISI